MSNLIDMAFNFAKEKHKNQYRKNGEPYFLHVHRVGQNLLDLGFDQETVIAGILHDTLEDTDTTRSEIDTLFGDNVGLMVESVSKIRKGSFDSFLKEADFGQTARILYYREKLLRMAIIAPGALAIKAADNIDNLFDIKALSCTKLERKIKEVENIFLPLYHDGKIIYQYKNPELITSFEQLVIKVEEAHKFACETLQAKNI